MSRFYSYLNSAATILSRYLGESPFHLYLKAFFRNHKKYGSRDRREIGNLCYCYFRLGKSLQEIEIEERILIGYFLCTKTQSQLLEVAKPEWQSEVSKSFEEKLEFLDIESIRTEVFPWSEQLSKELDYESFLESFFIQPDLFLRLRPGNERLVCQKLQKKEIEFEVLSNSALAIPNSRKVDQVVELNREAVVQDLSSQRIGEVLKEVLKQDARSVWDCCAASGGKSIMAYDINSRIKLTVSDVRPSILMNLKSRFRTAGISRYTSFEADLSSSFTQIRNSPFETIIADVPCTGSGTWGRSPEQMFYFENSKIDKYVSLQRKIVKNAIAHLKPDGDLVYITCSVFKKENEENIEFFKNELGLQEVRREVIKGYSQKADTMFVSVLNRV